MISLQNPMQALPSTPTSFPLDFTSQWPPGASGSALGVQVPPAQLCGGWHTRPVTCGMEPGQGTTRRRLHLQEPASPSWVNGTDAEAPKPGQAQRSVLPWAVLAPSDAPVCKPLMDGCFRLTIDHPSGSRRFVSGPSAHWSSQCAGLIGSTQSRTITSEKPCILGQLNK